MSWGGLTQLIDLSARWARWGKSVAWMGTTAQATSTEYDITAADTELRYVGPPMIGQ